MLEKAQLYFEQSMFAAFYVLVQFMLYNLDIGTISYVLMYLCLQWKVLHFFIFMQE